MFHFHRWEMIISTDSKTSHDSIVEIWRCKKCRKLRCRIVGIDGDTRIVDPRFLISNELIEMLKEMPHGKN